MHPELLRQYLEYYQDLGMKSLYRRTPPPPQTLFTEPRASASGRNANQASNAAIRSGSFGTTKGWFP